LTVCDGIVAGEGEGPLSPGDRPLGVVIASTDPVAVDLTAIALMGFEAEKLPKVRRAMTDTGLRITQVHSEADVALYLIEPPNTEPVSCELAAITGSNPFDAHPGWRGAIEKQQR
jgi:uncharacterized protein (DUF362 family)